MLLGVKQTIGSRLKATDGPLGRLEDVYFDDRTWEVRWLVASLGTQRTAPRVLINPRCIRAVPSGAVIDLGITTALARQSPPAGSALPVSRQYTAYGSGGRSCNSGDPHLQSCLSLLQGFSLAEEGESMGVLVDFCLDARIWTLPFISFRSEDGSMATHPTEIIHQISNAGSKLLLRRFPLGLTPQANAVAAA